ncbi:hydroxyethylthiazole kinase [Trinickia sp. YCB016]
MIISPPFLPKSAGHEMDSVVAGDAIPPEHNVCEAGMQQCAPGNGAYPVSFSLGWHGGAHLMVPRDARGDAERVRAIADGVVVFVRETDDTEKAALSYRGVRTDDGCVVLKHTTEIGEGENAKVTYFSIYMHLQTVVGALAVGKKVYRKDVLGVAGAIYGQLGQMHFEIVCDEANLKKLVGRTSTTLSAGAGRTDAIYGDMWFKVPAGAKLFAQEPHPYRRDDSESVPGPALSPQASLVAGGTRCELLVRMRYERGDCVLTTFREQGGRYVEVGQQREPEQEYNLYKRSTTISAKYVELNKALRANYAAVPSASSIYEMLRFGRIVGPDKLPANAKFGHWRRIVTPEATGWLNLNGPEIGVYSDADFPHWAGWSLISDDVTPDSLCDSPTIKRWLDLNGDGHVTHAEAKEALYSAVVQERLSRAICKFPSEWSKDDNLIETRMGWLKRPSDAWPRSLSDNEFSALKAHIQALAFWEDIRDAELPSAEQCWRFPPKAFVEHFGKCGWLGETDLLTTLRTVSSSGKVRANAFRTEMNKLNRKYLIARKRLRMAHFLAQIGHETEWWQFRQESGSEDYFRTMYEVITPAEALSDFRKGIAKRRGLVREGDTESSYSIRRPSEVAQKAKGMDNGVANANAGGKEGDGARFRGRGFLQITGRRNYAGYSKYRGCDFLMDPHPELLATNDYNVCDASGFFWAREVGNRVADGGDSAENVTRVGGLVNRGNQNKVPLHRKERQDAFDSIWRALNDK